MRKEIIEQEKANMRNEEKKFIATKRAHNARLQLSLADPNAPVPEFQIIKRKSTLNLLAKDI